MREVSHPASTAAYKMPFLKETMKNNSNNFKSILEILSNTEFPYRCFIPRGDVKLNAFFSFQGNMDGPFSYLPSRK